MEAQPTATGAKTSSPPRERIQWYVALWLIALLAANPVLFASVLIVASPVEPLLAFPIGLIAFFPFIVGAGREFTLSMMPLGFTVYAPSGWFIYLCHGWVYFRYDRQFGRWRMPLIVLTALLVCNVAGCHMLRTEGAHIH